MCWMLPGSSTETAMIDTMNFLSSAMENGHVSTLVAAETSRAFDSIEHVRLIDKLGWYGVIRLVWCRQTLVRGLAEKQDSEHSGQLRRDIASDSRGNPGLIAGSKVVFAIY